MWHYCDDGRWKDLLVVYGGSTAGGLVGDVWLFDVAAHRWTQVSVGLGWEVGGMLGVALMHYPACQAGLQG